MLSDEYYIMHLTPHGWVEGTEKTARGMVERSDHQHFQFFGIQGTDSQAEDQSGGNVF